MPFWSSYFFYEIYVGSKLNGLVISTNSLNGCASPYFNCNFNCYNTTVPHFMLEVIMYEANLTVSDQLRLKMAMILYSTFLVAPSVKQNLSTINWGKSMPTGDLHNNVFSRHTHFFQFEFCFRNSVGSRSKIPFFSLWFACLVAKWYLQF